MKNTVMTVMTSIDGLLRKELLLYSKFLHSGPALTIIRYTGYYSLCSYVLDKCSSRSVYLGVCPVQYTHYVKLRTELVHGFIVDGFYFIFILPSISEIMFNVSSLFLNDFF